MPFDHQHRQLSAGQVLLGQIGATGHQPLVDVAVGDDFQQFVELGGAQALILVGLYHLLAIGPREVICAIDQDLPDRKTTTVGSWSRRR
ncbi:hypothetical protein D3C84_948140 [compost metagenome]